jgi:hypothetical protein
LKALRTSAAGDGGGGGSGISSPRRSTGSSSKINAKNDSGKEVVLLVATIGALLVFSVATDTFSLAPDWPVIL